MFFTWMIGFLLVMTALVWIAVVVGLPQPFVGLAVGALLVLAALVALALATVRKRRLRHRP